MVSELPAEEEEISQDGREEGILSVHRKHEAVRTHHTSDGGRRERVFAQEGKVLLHPRQGQEPRPGLESEVLVTDRNVIGVPVLKITG